MLPYYGNELQSRPNRANSIDSRPKHHNTMARQSDFGFGGMSNMMDQMMESHSKAMKQSMKMFDDHDRSFGKMMDPFKNDPFFSDSGFGSIEKHFSKANSMMSKMFEEADGLMRSNTTGGSGRFMSQKFVSSTKMGSDGRPVQESYQTKARGVYGGRSSKPEIVERKQMYSNTGTGYEKAAHERMYQGKGRKIVMERDRNQSNAMNSYNYYKNMREEEAPNFDKEWDNAAQRLGFNADTKALAYGAGVGRPSFKKSNSYNNYGSSGSYMDHSKRGHYVSSYLKGSDMPVRVNKPETHVERLMPTDTSHRLDVPNNHVANPNAPLALPSNENRGTIPRARVNNNRTNVNYAANRGNKRARIG